MGARNQRREWERSDWDRFRGRDRRRSSAEVKTRVGYDYAHAIVDDHTRLAYVELLDEERAPTVTAFVERALSFFAGHAMSRNG